MGESREDLTFTVAIAKAGGLLLPENFSLSPPRGRSARGLGSRAVARKALNLAVRNPLGAED